jgi:hypothetical protein
MEVDSVAITNMYYYIVKDNELATTLAELVEAVHADWWSRVADLMSIGAATTCSIWENLNGNDPTFAVFQTIIGNSLTDNLPVEKAIIVSKKAVNAQSKIVNSINKLSGLAEDLQKGGHLLDYEIALGLETWLTEDQSYGPTVIKNVIRSKDGEGFQINEVVAATTNPHIVSVPSRQPVLCRSA